jgi:hypothetical protein
MTKRLVGALYLTLVFASGVHILLIDDGIQQQTISILKGETR